MTKDPANLLSVLLLVLCYSCSSYSAEQSVPVEKLNDSIQAAASKDEAWAQNPEAISKHLFPSDADPKGNRNYTVKVDRTRESACDVRVIDEGSSDGGLYGRQWKAAFKQTGGRWQLSKLTRSSKRINK